MASYNKIILITGCSKETGVGYNLTQTLLARGHRVIATVRNIEKSQLAHAPFASSENLIIKSLDLCDLNSIENLVSEVINEYKYIDVLVNNAADVVLGPIETASAEDVYTTFQTKVFGPITLIQGFVPAMRERCSGLIMTTSSIFCSAYFAVPGFPIYLAALDAFERIQEALSIELAPWKIKVINYQPGPIKTELTHRLGQRHAVQDNYQGYLETCYQWFREKL